MQIWGAQREVERGKPQTQNKRVTVESGTCRLVVRMVHDDEASDGVNVWLGMDHDSLPEFIIGQGRNAEIALTDAVSTLEALLNGVQERRYPQDWSKDPL